MLVLCDAALSTHKLYLVLLSEFLVQVRAHDLVSIYRSGGEVVLHEQSNTLKTFSLFQPDRQ